MSKSRKGTADYVAGKVEVVLFGVEECVHKHGEEGGVDEDGDPGELEDSHFLLGLGLESGIRTCT